jgi:hypothetical protein
MKQRITVNIAVEDNDVIDNLLITMLQLWPAGGFSIGTLTQVFVFSDDGRTWTDFRKEEKAQP